jgi:hypothetical protein
MEGTPTWCGLAAHHYYNREGNKLLSKRPAVAKAKLETLHYRNEWSMMSFVKGSARR